MLRLTNKTDAPKPNATNTCLKHTPLPLLLPMPSAKEIARGKTAVIKITMQLRTLYKNKFIFSSGGNRLQRTGDPICSVWLGKMPCYMPYKYQFTFDTKVKHFPPNLSVMALSAQQDEKAWRVNEWNVSENDGTIFTNTWLWYPLCVRSAKPDICTWEDQ